jgi:protoporphyrinogen oxidase
LQVLNTGYQSLWETIAKKDLLDIKLGVRVKSIDRDLKGDKTSPIVICGSDAEGEELKIECDFLVLACDYKQFLEVFTDTTDQEAELFQSYGTKGFIHSIMELPLDPNEKRSFAFYPEVLTADQEGKLYNIRNPKKMFALDESKDSTRRVITAQLYNSPVPNDRLDEAASAALAHLKEMGVNVEEVKVIKQCSWEYFPHFRPVGHNFLV